jgi:stage V sporulation protein R
MSLTPDLQDWKTIIRDHAKSYGLDFWEVVFELLDLEQINMVAAHGGFPTRYPHWRFGMEYEQIAKGHTYGLSKIYEMVINNDPAYAYLLDSNRLVDQKLVMAHVYAHADFFKNNMWFVHTNRKMMDDMANHGTRVRRYIERFGLERVESFIDNCLSLDNLIDFHAPHIVRRAPKKEQPMSADEVEDKPARVAKIRANREYMDEFVNPPDFIQAQLRKIEEERNKELPFPEQPERDIMQFLMEHAPLKTWERDVLGIIREEAYYFAPQRQTKIMNEGWAVFWHSRIMTEKVLNAEEVIDYADLHSGALAGGKTQLNPYKLGVEIFRDIEDRWNRGKFGKEYDECDDMAQRRRWDKRLGLGREKVFQVRRLYNDVMFIDEFFTEEFCREQKMYTFALNEDSGNYEIKSREFRQVKQQLLHQLTNLGQPFIFITDGNYKNRGELLLQHRYEGVPLKMDHAQDTLTNLFRMWKRPVNLESVIDDKPALITFDGQDHKVKS